MAATQGIVVLGSTGSVGRNALAVIASFPDRFHLVGLAANTDSAALQAQIDAYAPRYVALSASAHAELRGAQRVDSQDPLLELATLAEADIIVVATTGHAAIPATLAALRAGKVVALANKETIVAAGAIVMPVARAHPGNLRPVDSEHSAIWQCLPASGRATSEVARILLTASGGPFRGSTAGELREVDVAQALAHPTWNMGSRITIDSATLMNKGFELIETAWLFDCPIRKIRILLHPQSIVHSMVEYADGSIMAHLASHDMRLPIQYALTYPDRPEGPARKLTVDDFARLDFEEPDFETFRAPLLARRAHEAGGTYPAVLSTADQVAVDAFLAQRIGFTQIVELVERALDAHKPEGAAITLEQIEAVDRWTIEYVNSRLSGSSP